MDARSAYTESRLCFCRLLKCLCEAFKHSSAYWEVPATLCGLYLPPSSFLSLWADGLIHSSIALFFFVHSLYCQLELHDASVQEFCCTRCIGIVCQCPVSNLRHIYAWWAYANTWHYITMYNSAVRNVKLLRKWMFIVRALGYPNNFSYFSNSTIDCDENNMSRAAEGVDMDCKLFSIICTYTSWQKRYNIKDWYMDNITALCTSSCSNSLSSWLSLVQSSCASETLNFLGSVMQAKTLPIVFQSGYNTACLQDRCILFINLHL